MQQSTASPRLVLGECVRGRGKADTPNSEQCVVGSLFEHATSKFQGTQSAMGQGLCVLACAAAAQWCDLASALGRRA